MSSVWSLICFEHGGSSVLLYNDEECRDAIKNGLLSPDTQIDLTVDEKRYRLRAKEAGVYGLRFDEPTAINAVTRIAVDLYDDQASVDVRPLLKTVVPGNEQPQYTAVDFPKTAITTNIGSAKFLPTVPNRSLVINPRNWQTERLKVLVSILVVFIIAAWWFLPVTPLVKLWTARAVTVHHEAGGEAIPGILIPRGEPVIIFKTRGEWVKLADGDNELRYLRLTHLSKARPPVLDVDGWGMKTLVESAVIVNKPGDDGGIIQLLRSGGDVNANGIVLPDRLWVEVLLADGGVGYVKSSAFGLAASSDKAPMQSSTRTRLNRESDKQIKPELPAAVAARERIRSKKIVAPLPNASLPVMSTDADAETANIVSAVPTRDPSTWINPNDYPFSASSRGEEGIVEFELQVGNNGRVTRCNIVTSSGFSDLDKKTCRLIKDRARFRQSNVFEGKNASAVYSGDYQWQLP